MTNELECENERNVASVQVRRDMEQAWRKISDIIRTRWEVSREIIESARRPQANARGSGRLHQLRLPVQPTHNPPSTLCPPCTYPTRLPNSVSPW